ncbi:MAG: HTTM domain-containing protein [Myxococcota bacterium]
MSGDAVSGDAMSGDAVSGAAQRRADRERPPSLTPSEGRWTRLVNILDEREAPTSLAMIRIAVAIVLLADWFTALRLGLVPTIWGPSTAGGLGAADTWADPPLFQVLFGASTTATWTVFAIAVAATITLGIGLMTRTSALVVALASAQLAMAMGQSDRGIDIALRIVLMLLACSGAGARWSLDARLRHGTFTPELTVPAWPRYLIILQLLWMYFGAGLHKTQSAWWPQGDLSALYIILRDPHFATADFASLDALYTATQLGTFATMLFELGAPLMGLSLWYRRTRERPGRLRRWFNRLRVGEIWLALGIAFHIGLMFTLRLGIFPYGMLAFYPAFFPPSELDRGLERVRGLIERVRLRLAKTRT